MRLRTKLQFCWWVITGHLAGWSASIDDDGQQWEAEIRFTSGHPMRLSR